MDTLQDLYLRTLLPLGIAAGAATLGLVVVGLELPVAALALGVPLVLACTVPTVLAWRSAGDDSAAALGGALSAQVVDAIHGAADLLAFGADEATLDRLETMSAEAMTIERRQANANSLATLVTQLCAGSAVLAVLAVTVSAVHAGHLNPVMVAVLPLAALGTFEPIPGIALAATRSRAVAAAARRLLALEEVPVPVHDPDVPSHLGAGSPEISFAHASLRYAPDLPRALDGVALEVAPGARVAVTGSSGAGKSSLVNALLRFWPLEEGVLALGGIAVDQLRQTEVRATCALVDQRAQLFAGTVRSNVTLGRPDATEEEVGSVLEAAQLTQWVDSLPSGLETQVGEDGVAISGGERRRLAVARALLAGGPVLLLDEPTAGLDAPTAERLITDVLAAAGPRSVVLITHRAHEAAQCDSIVTLEEGRIVS